MAIILANDGIDAKAKASLEELGHIVDVEKYEGEALLKRLAEVDVVIVRSATKLRDEQLKAGSEGNLKLAIRAGVGLDNIDLDKAKEYGVEVTNTPTASSDAVAELALAHIFALSRNLYASNVTMREGQWLKKQYKGCEISGKNLGLIGFGRISRSLAEKASALGMRILYTNRSGAKEGYEKYTYLPMEELLKESDYISIHVPFAGGKALLGAEELNSLKDGVFIVNTARGGVVDEDALVDAIESGKVKAAALDVFAEEPCKNERLLNCDKISLTPHIGAATNEAQARIGDVIVEIIKEKF